MAYRRRIRVLIVDDSPVVCDKLDAALSEIPGVDIIGQSGDVPAAVEAAGKLRPDVIILEIRIRGGSGIALLQRIKQEECAPYVIVFTNYPQARYREECAQAGADFFFDKLTDFREMVEVFKLMAKCL